MSYIIEYLSGGWKECTKEERKLIDTILFYGALMILSGGMMVISDFIDEPTLVTMSGICLLGLGGLMLFEYFAYKLDKIEDMLSKKSPRKKVKKNGR